MSVYPLLKGSLGGSNRAPPFDPPFVQVQRQGCSALRAISLAPGGLSVCLEVGSVGPDVNVVGV